MSAPFAAIEARINAAAMAHCANATATLTGGAVVQGEFNDDGYINPLGVAGSEPNFRADSAALAGLSYGSVITIDGTAYTVRQIDPDGTGLTRLVLER